LPDDNEGGWHQKFIIRLLSGQTILIAHNIDLAPKIGSLQEGDTVEFFGQYEWNGKGGLGIGLIMIQMAHIRLVSCSTKVKNINDK
jgi:hypothetical protein